MEQLSQPDKLEAVKVELDAAIREERALMEEYMKGEFYQPDNGSPVTEEELIRFSEIQSILTSAVNRTESAATAYREALRGEK